MRMSMVYPRGGLMRRNIPAKLDWTFDKRKATDSPPPPAMPNDPMADDLADPAAPPTPGGGPKGKGPPGLNGNGTASAEPSGNPPPTPGKGPKKGNAPGLNGNGTAPVEPNGNPPPTPGKGPKKEKAPVPADPTASGIPPPPPPPTGTPPSPPLPSGGAGLGPSPTTVPPAPPTPKPKPTGMPPPPPGPKGPKAPPTPSISQTVTAPTTLSTSLIPSAVPETLPQPAGGGIGSSTGTNSGAVLESNATSVQANSSQSRTTMALSIVVIIVGSVALITGFVFLLRHIMRRRRLGPGKAPYAEPYPPAPPMQSYPTPDRESQSGEQYSAPLGSNLTYPVGHYSEAYAPVIMEGRDYNIRKTIAGGEDLGGFGGSDKMALSNMLRTSVISERTLQERSSMANAYPRDVKAPIQGMPRDV